MRILAVEALMATLPWNTWGLDGVGPGGSGPIGGTGRSGPSGGLGGSGPGGGATEDSRLHMPWPLRVQSIAVCHPVVCSHRRV